MKTIEIFKTNRFCFIGAVIFAFSIAFGQTPATIGLVLWLVGSCFGFDRNLVQRNVLLLLPVLVFITYVVGYFITNGNDFSFLERKASLLVFPLIFFAHKYTKPERNVILKAFVCGVFLSSLICLTVSVYNSTGYNSEGFNFTPNVLENRGFFESIMYGGNYFFGNHFSIFHQTVYFALYLCAAIAIMLFKPSLVSKRKNRFLFISFFLLIIFLVSNKSAFIAVMVIFLIWIGSLDLPIIKRVVLLSIMALIAIATLFSNPRTKAMFQKVDEGQMVLNKDARYGFPLRLLCWDAAISLIKQNSVIGYGGTNAQSELNQVYQKKEYKYALRDKLNAHNLFMQVWIENGVLGLLASLLVFYGLFVQAFRHKKFEHNNLFIVLVTLLLISSLFESIFSRFSGILFFSFLSCFIFSARENKLESEPTPFNPKKDN
ncbi:MAG: O-antigen ligase domain-containing protein [Allomuricauda sp.]|nr:MAG: O-antigen ligase domain-containing protein [Allomuricauda sp.]